ncbi:putative fatty-acid amide hydrolase protein [Phaeoacremonium minimum UCRPA7]|uniref:Putative fatty-acid amide hydrolase protein n=1 Tax=Phaeoacremonium minimum (strain UCR-PA7) TaxID=1286976 RepID=R8BXA9_PHAM7|nr:putative fatty-acid amide hydrolase protein [Phaeoacremonium minimum UCRPA7]EOO03988.1 putative fatty-acid amide hydrolase protein [Phaeoacremonium minimum UCRPA7]
MFVADGGLAIRAEVERGGEPWRPEMAGYETATELGTSAMWKLHLERVDFQKRYLDRWNAAGIDAILAPTTPFSTVKHGTFKHVGYTGVYNILDYSCVSFPSGFSVDKDIDVGLGDSHVPLGDVCKIIHEEYDAGAVHGMPISLQLIARRLEEEKAISTVKKILETV